MCMLPSIVAAEHRSDHLVDVHGVREPVTYFPIRKDGIGLIQPHARGRLRVVSVKPDLVYITVVEVFALEFIVPKLRQYTTECIELTFKEML